MDKADIWSALAAALPTGVISWQQDGRIINRDGRHVARFVAYIEANIVRERLDGVVPGECDLTLEKRNPKAPDFKCRDRSCDGVIWPSRGDSSEAARIDRVDASAHHLTEEIPF